MIAGQMGSGLRHQSDEPGDKSLGLKDHMRRAISKGCSARSRTPARPLLAFLHDGIPANLGARTGSARGLNRAGARNFAILLS